MHHCLLYTAKACKPFDRATLAHILGIARIRNEMSGITGILLYGRSSVMQCLEGPQAQVESALERIKQDPLVYDVRVEVSRSSAERLFPNWSMAFDHRDDADKLPEAIDLRNTNALPDSGGRFDIVLTMLRNFRDAVAFMAPPMTGAAPSAGSQPAGAP